MLHVSLWSRIVTSLVVLAGILVALPNALSDNFLSKMPAWLPHSAVNLGLDLQGGSYLLLEVQLDQVQKDKLESVMSDIRVAMRKARIAFNVAAKDDTITLTVRDLFASGSAQVDSRYDALVNEVGVALSKVPGRILVIGHTDDQPLRSFRFKDNYELSRARAQHVADLIRAAVHDGARIEVAGKGSLEPRYQPVNTPENRARNRRVEIIHRRAG